MKMYLRMTMLLFVAMSLQNQVSAQGEKNTQYQFKVYSNFEYALVNFTDIHKNKSFDFGNITPSFVISKPRVSHEIGISRLYIGQNDNYKGEETLSNGAIIPAEGEKRTRFNLNLRYEYGLNLIKINKKHQLSIAASTEPYIEVHKFIPRIASDFPNILSIVGNKVHLIPRATFSLSERLFLDVNIPVEIIDAYRLKNYSNNPTLAEELRVYSDTRSEFFDSVFRFRIGLGFNL